jgi:hypothetical protein
MGIARIACNWQKQYVYVCRLLDRKPNTKRDYNRDRYIQHSAVIDQWKILDKDVRGLQNQTLFLAFAVMVLNTRFCLCIAICIVLMGQ